MANTYKIREVTVTIPKIGIVSSDKEGNEFKCGEIYHINLFAMRPGWQTRTSDFDGLIVGRLDFSGYTESPYSRTQKIIMPNGYELVALRVGECGRPMIWESLPVVFSDAPLSDSEPFNVKNGEVYINDAFIDKAAASADYSMKVGVNHNSKGYVAGMALNVEEEHLTEREKVHAVVSKYLMGEATEYTDELVDELMSLCRAAISIESEGKQSCVEFKADRFAIHKNAQAIINNANYNVKVNPPQNPKQYAVGMGISVNPAATKWRLNDQMHEAIINAVAESDLFKSLEGSVNAQAALIAGLHLAIPDAVNDAIRNALKPGGAIWGHLGGR